MSRNLLRLGVTGTIGSGKSLVGEILASVNVPVIDTDKVVHELFSTDSELQTEIARRFGDHVLHKSETNKLAVDRKALGKIVFQNESLRRDLEELVHPRVRQACKTRIEQLPDNEHSLVAVLVPLLFEAKQQNEYGRIWTVVTDEPSLRRRLAERDDLTDSEIERRLKAQLSQEEKAALAHDVIDNSGTKEQTREQVLRHLDKIRQ